MAVADPTARRRARIVLSVVILASTAAVLWGLDLYGRSSRVFTGPPAIVELERPAQAYDLWRERGARGRTLLLFGPFPHPWRSSDEGPHPRGPDSFVTLAALENVVRRIYVLVPDDEWEARFSVPLPGFFRPVPGVGRGTYMHYPLGLPVVATTPSSLPRLDEPSLVYVDRRRFDPETVVRFLARARHPYDLLVVSGGL